MMGLVCVGAWGETYYWIGGTSEIWEKGANWSTTIGGTSDGTYPDDNTDTAIINGNKTVTISLGSDVQLATFQLNSATVTLELNGNTLNVSGFLNLGTGNSGSYGNLILNNGSVSVGSIDTCDAGINSLTLINASFNVSTNVYDNGTGTTTITGDSSSSITFPAQTGYNGNTTSFVFEGLVPGTTASGFSFSCDSAPSIGSTVNVNIQSTGGSGRIYYKAEKVGTSDGYTVNGTEMRFGSFVEIETLSENDILQIPVYYPSSIAQDSGVKIVFYSGDTEDSAIGTLNFIQKTAVTKVTVWKDPVDRSWKNDSNWTNGVPQADGIVTIGFADKYPVIDEDTANLRSLTISSGAELTLEGLYNLNSSKVINNGTLFIKNDNFTVGTKINGKNSTINYDDGATSASWGESYENLVNNGTITGSTGDITVNGNYSGNGTFKASSGSTTFFGNVDLSEAASFDANGGTIKFFNKNGQDAITFKTRSNMIFNNFWFCGNTRIEIDGDVKVDGFILQDANNIPNDCKQTSDFTSDIVVASEKNGTLTAKSMKLCNSNGEQVIADINFDVDTEVENYVQLTIGSHLVINKDFKAKLFDCISGNTSPQPVVEVSGKLDVTEQMDLASNYGCTSRVVVNSGGNLKAPKIVWARTDSQNFVTSNDERVLFNNAGTVEITGNGIIVPEKNTNNETLELSNSGTITFTDSNATLSASKIKGSGTINFAGGTITETSATSSIGTLTITGATGTTVSGKFDIGTLTSKKSSLAFDNECEFGTFNIGSDSISFPITVTFPAEKTQTIGTISCEGSSINNVTLQSDTAGSKWNVTFTNSPKNSSFSHTKVENSSSTSNLYLYPEDDSITDSSLSLLPASYSTENWFAATYYWVGNKSESWLNAGGENWAFDESKTALAGAGIYPDYSNGLIEIVILDSSRNILDLSSDVGSPITNPIKVKSITVNENQTLDIGSCSIEVSDSGVGITNNGKIRLKGDSSQSITGTMVNGTNSTIEYYGTNISKLVWDGDDSDTDFQYVNLEFSKGSAGTISSILNVSGTTLIANDSGKNLVFDGTNTFTGKVTLGDGSTQAGNVTLSGANTFGGDIVITDAGDVTFSSGNNSYASEKSVTITNADDIILNGNALTVASGANCSSLNIKCPVTLENVTTTETQTYENIVTLSGDATLSGSSIIFDDNCSKISGTGKTLTFDGDVTSKGAIEYEPSVVVNASKKLSGTGTITFDSAVTNKGTVEVPSVADGSDGIIFNGNYSGTLTGSTTTNPVIQFKGNSAVISVTGENTFNATKFTGSSQTVTLSDNNTFNSLSITGNGSEFKFGAGQTQTVFETLIVTGEADTETETNKITLKSTLPDSQWNISVGNLTGSSVSYVKLSDSNNVSSDYLVALNSDDNNNNDRWSFTGNEYTWTGSNGTNWYDKANWSPKSIPGVGTKVKIVKKTNAPKLEFAVTGEEIPIETVKYRSVGSTGEILVDGGIFDLSDKNVTAAKFTNNGRVRIGGNQDIKVNDVVVSTGSTTANLVNGTDSVVEYYGSSTAVTFTSLAWGKDYENVEFTGNLVINGIETGAGSVDYPLTVQKKTKVLNGEGNIFKLTGNNTFNGEVELGSNTAKAGNITLSGKNIFNDNITITDAGNVTFSSENNSYASEKTVTITKADNVILNGNDSGFTLVSDANCTSLNIKCPVTLGNVTTTGKISGTTLNETQLYEKAVTLSRDSTFLGGENVVHFAGTVNDENYSVTVGNESIKTNATFSDDVTVFSIEVKGTTTFNKTSSQNITTTDTQTYSGDVIFNSADILINGSTVSAVSAGSDVAVNLIDSEKIVTFSDSTAFKQTSTKTFTITSGNVKVGKNKFDCGKLVISADSSFVQTKFNSSDETENGTEYSQSVYGIENNGKCIWDSSSSGGTLSLFGSVTGSNASQVLFNKKNVKVETDITLSGIFYDLVIPAEKTVTNGSGIVVRRNLTVNGTYSHNEETLTLGGIIFGSTYSSESGEISDKAATPTEFGNIVVNALDGTDISKTFATDFKTKSITFDTTNVISGLILGKTGTTGVKFVSDSDIVIPCGVTLSSDSEITCPNLEMKSTVGGKDKKLTLNTSASSKITGDIGSPTEPLGDVSSTNSTCKNTFSGSIFCADFKINGNLTGNGNFDAKSIYVAGTTKLINTGSQKINTVEKQAFSGDFTFAGNLEITGTESSFGGNLTESVAGRKVDFKSDDSVINVTGEVRISELNFKGEGQNVTLSGENSIGTATFSGNSQNVTLSADNTFSNLSLTGTGSEFTFGAGKTQTVTNILTITGADDTETEKNRITMKSSEPGSQWNISVGNLAETSVSYVKLSDSNNISLDYLEALNSIDEDNNDRWTFAGNSYVWTGSNGTNWYDKLNWSPKSIPGPKTNVSVPAVEKHPVLEFNVTGEEIEVVSGSGVKFRSLGEDATITVEENSQIDLTDKNLTAKKFTNNGRVRIGGNQNIVVSTGSTTAGSGSTTGKFVNGDDSVVEYYGSPETTAFTKLAWSTEYQNLEFNGNLSVQVADSEKGSASLPITVNGTTFVSNGEENAFELKGENTFRGVVTVSGSGKVVLNSTDSGFVLAPALTSTSLHVMSPVTLESVTTTGLINGTASDETQLYEKEVTLSGNALLLGGENLVHFGDAVSGAEYTLSVGNETVLTNVLFSGDVNSDSIYVAGNAESSADISCGGTIYIEGNSVFSKSGQQSIVSAGDETYKKSVKVNSALKIQAGPETGENTASIYLNGISSGNGSIDAVAGTKIELKCADYITQGKQKFTAKQIRLEKAETAGEYTWDAEKIETSTLIVDFAESTVILASNLTADNFYFYNGKMQLTDVTLSTLKTFAAWGKAFDSTDYRYSASNTRFNLAGFERNKNENSAEFAVLNGATFAVGTNFYINGLDLSGDSLKLVLPENGDSSCTFNNSASAREDMWGLENCFAAVFNSTIKNTKVECAQSGKSAYISAAAINGEIKNQGVVDGGNNTSVTYAADGTVSGLTGFQFNYPQISKAYSVYDDVVCVEFNIPLENTSDEISKQIELNSSKETGGLWYNSGGLCASAGVFTDADCTQPLKADAANITKIYVRTASGTWNTDATGKTVGEAESTDRNDNHKSITTDLTWIVGAFVAEHGHTMSQNYGLNGAESYKETEDHCAPVMVEVYTGQEKHVYGEADVQSEYDAHNFIEFKYSEAVDIGDMPFDGAELNQNKQAQTEFASDSAHGGAITNVSGGLNVAGYGHAESGIVEGGINTAAGPVSYGNTEIHSLYRYFSVTSDGPAKNQTHRIRLSVAGFVDGSVQVGSKTYHNWKGYLNDVETPSGVFKTVVNPYIHDRAADTGATDSAGTPLYNKYDGAGTAENHKLLTMQIRNSISSSTLYGPWDVQAPVFAPFVRNQADFKNWADGSYVPKYHEIVGSVESDANPYLQNLEFHFFDNQDYELNWWKSKVGWMLPSDDDEKETASIAKLPEEIGGNRDFVNGSSITSANQTTGGIRRSSLEGANRGFSYSYELDEAKADRREVGTGQISQLVKSNIFRMDEDELTKDDGLYISVPLNSVDLAKLPVRTRFEVNFDSDKSCITDLAGNRLRFDKIVTMSSLDLVPPAYTMTLAPIGHDKIYVMFTKALFYKTKQLQDLDESQFAEFKEKLCQSFKIVKTGTGDIQSEYEIVDVQRVSETMDCTALLFTLNDTVTLTKIETLSLYAKGVEGEIVLNNFGQKMLNTYIRDEIENYLEVGKAHVISDFAVNAVKVLYAYSDVAGTGWDEQGIYGTDVAPVSSDYAAHEFDADAGNYGKLRSGGDITVQVEFDNDNQQERVLEMVIDKKAALSENWVSDTYNKLTGSSWRVWLDSPHDSLASGYNASPLETPELSDVPDSDTLKNFTFKNDVFNFKGGDEFQFIFRIKDGSGAYITLNHDNDPTTPEIPLYGLWMPEDRIARGDFSFLDLWSFGIKDITSQRGGVTVLNNVIDVNLREQSVIQVDMKNAGNLNVYIMTLDGNIVQRLSKGRTEAGTHYFKWDGTNLAGKAVARGLYFVRVSGPGIDETRKIMCVKN
ncbi:MAG: hypothetical protein KBT11_10640 [Treponema sp.]|nr:hypothetical protein [Candidatus Treponema equifaecale]